jgi:threonine synthase
MAQPPFRCTSCRQTQPLEFAGWKCPACGGVLDLDRPPIFDPQQIERRERGLWRYRHTLPLPPGAQRVTLGEGGTPLAAIKLGDRILHCKLESLNPTGSFKDRGMAVMFTALKAIGARDVIEDSSGNAGVSFAAYAARAGIQARVFVPASASGRKRAQIAAHGAEVVAVDGPRTAAAGAARREAEGGARYASHVYNPIGLAGHATAAYEIWEQMGRAPECIVVPVGHGTLLLGLHRGFKALRAAGLIDRLPRLIGVQALACAPIWAAFTYGRDGLLWVTEGQTIAEGIRVLQPVRGDAVLAAVVESGGALRAVDDAAVQSGRAALARLGLYVEPTSAVVWEALSEVKGEVVVVLTGNGLKT